MDTCIKDLGQTVVDDLDEELYNREAMGCQAQVDKTGACATFTCPEAEGLICQKTEDIGIRWLEREPEYPWTGSL